MEQSTYKVGLYWDKSYWNGFRSLPVIVSINEKHVSVKTGKEVVFDVPLDEVKAGLSSWGSFFLYVNGKKYRFTTTGATISPNFTKEQNEELLHNNNMTAVQRLEQMGFGLGPALSHAGGALGVAGLASETIAVASKVSSYYGKKDVLDQLCDLLVSLNVPVKRKKQTLIKNTLLLYLAVFIMFILIMFIVGFVQGVRGQ